MWTCEQQIYLICRYAGPGAYNPLSTMDKGNMMTARDSREKPLKENNPGPGYYEVSRIL